MNNFKLPYLFSAPIAGYTNSIIRDLFAEGGADYIFSEMYNVNEILNRKIEELDLFKTNYNLIIQLFGKFNDNFESAIEKIKNISFYIDINAGCPVKKVIKAKTGSYFLKYPEKIYKLLTRIKSTFNDIKLSIKLRLGFDRINILETIEAATKANVDFITIHFRTREEFFACSVDWENYFDLYNKIVKINNKIVINGDIDTIIKAYYLIKKYSPFGLMIGRAALHDPLIFNKIKEYYLFNNLYNFEKINYLNQYNLSLLKKLNKIDKIYNYELFFNPFYFFYSKHQPIYIKKIYNKLISIQNVQILKKIYSQLKTKIVNKEIYKNDKNLSHGKLKISEFRKISHYLLKGLPDANKIKNYINNENDINKLINYFNNLS